MYLKVYNSPSRRMTHDAWGCGAFLERIFLTYLRTVLLLTSSTTVRAVGNNAKAFDEKFLPYWRVKSRNHPVITLSP